MTTFDKREKGFEQEFVHTEELKFKAKARRDHMLGLWAAKQLGLDGTAAENYSRELIVEDVEAHDVVEKIRGDFAAKGVTQSEDQIRVTMAQLMTRAMAEIRAGR